MARKKKRWRDMDDPVDIFGGEHALDRIQQANDPAYDAFRRHIDEHIQGETRAFHELRSTAEHELQAASVAPSSPRRVPPPKKNLPQAMPAAPSMPVAAMMQPSAGPPKTSGVGTMVALGLIFTAIGFLLNSAWHQSQNLTPTRKTANSAKARLAADPNCVSEKTASSKKPSPSPKQAAVIPVSAVVDAAPSLASAPVSTPASSPAAAQATQVSEPVPVAAVETPRSAEPLLKGIAVRAVELRKGPGSNFEIVDSLPPGFALEGVLTTDRKWLRIKPGAFISTDAVQFQDASVPAYQSYWVAGNIANIREFPQITARIMRKAEPGSELKLQAFNSEWAQVSGGGFVFRKLVTSEAPRLLQLPAVMRVVVEKAEIRGGPGPNYPVLGLYFRNHKLEVQEAQGAWLRVGPDQFIRAQEMELSVKPHSDKTM